MQRVFLKITRHDKNGTLSYFKNRERMKMLFLLENKRSYFDANRKLSA